MVFQILLIDAEVEPSHEKLSFFRRYGIEFEYYKLSRRTRKIAILEEWIDWAVSFK